jgi:hypothetical protein
VHTVLDESLGGKHDAKDAPRRQRSRYSDRQLSPPNPSIAYGDHHASSQLGLARGDHVHDDPCNFFAAQPSWRIRMVDGCRAADVAKSAWKSGATKAICRGVRNPLVE